MTNVGFKCVSGIAAIGRHQQPYQQERAPPQFNYFFILMQILANIIPNPPGLAPSSGKSWIRDFINKLYIYFEIALYMKMGINFVQNVHFLKSHQIYITIV